MKNFLLVIVLGLLTNFVFGQKVIHTILLADTEDLTIGTSCAKDIEAINYQMTEITSVVENLTFKEHTIVGSQLTNSNVIAQLELLKIKSGDIVFFYFSGHGGSRSNEFELQLKLRDDYIPLAQIKDLLKHKGAQLVFYIIDSCNVLLDAPEFATKSKVDMSLPVRKEVYQSLFSFGGSFELNSCGPEEFSYSVEEEGSIFTASFINAINYYVRSDETKVDWEMIAEKARLDTYNFVKDEYQYLQTPHYDIHLFDVKSISRSLNNKAFSSQVRTLKPKQENN